MTSAHSQFNYNRRSSASASPYTIPMKHQHHQQFQNPANHHYPQAQAHSHSQSPALHGMSQSPANHSQSPANGHIASHQRSHSHGGHGHYYNQSSHDEAIAMHNDSGYEDDGYMMSSSVPTLSREFVVRRISEGETGRLKQELKCEACGKGYKHISSLAKHLWEHTPEWNVTKKLLISKHQQVQLLEAASILVGMNEFGPNSTSSRRNSVFNEDDDSPPPKDKHDFTYEKDRNNSISEFPPSNTPQEPGVHFVTGGYLDVKGTHGLKQRAGSITDQFNSNVNSPYVMSPRKSHDLDIDDEIVGKME